MKEKYMPPVVEKIELNSDDVITASCGNNNLWPGHHYGNNGEHENGQPNAYGYWKDKKKNH